MCLILLRAATPGLKTFAHPAEEPVRAHYEERITYLKPERIHYGLRRALDELLPKALSKYPAPSTTVTNEELELWALARASDVLHGGNNYFGLPYDAGELTPPVYRQHPSVATPIIVGMTRPEYEARREDLAQRALAGALPEKIDDWKDWIVRDRHRVNVIAVQAEIQLAFGERIGELRAGRPRLRIANAS